MITLWLTFLLCCSLSLKFSVWVVDVSSGLCNISICLEMSRRKLWHQYTSTILFFYALESKSRNDQCLILFSLHLFSLKPTRCLPLHLAVLDVYVLSTDGQVQDFKFPQSSQDGISIQLSANTVKLNSRNGKLTKRKERKRNVVKVTLRALRWWWSGCVFDFCSHLRFVEKVKSLSVSVQEHDTKEFISKTPSPLNFNQNTRGHI